MSSLVRYRPQWQPLCLRILAGVAAAALACGPAAAGELDETNPAFVPSVKWLPEPTPAKDSAAKTEAEMKPYTDLIPDTEVKFDMVPIRGGKFTMGSPPGEKERKKDEGPQHAVEIEPFWMGKCEVTWNEYVLWYMKIDRDRRRLKRGEQSPSKREELVDAVSLPSNTPFGDPTLGKGITDCPAAGMTQLAARVYCMWLSAKTGRYYRLPTEAEWEYACRAGTITAYSFGDDPAKLADYAWYFDNADDGPQRVGRKKPNPWGLYDMHGNAAEWVIDQYAADFYRQAGDKTIRCPLNLPKTWYPRSIRGGSWNDDPPTLRSAVRFASNEKFSEGDTMVPSSRTWHSNSLFVGFRLVRPLRTPTEKECRRYEPAYEDAKEYIESFKVVLPKAAKD